MVEHPLTDPILTDAVRTAHEVVWGVLTTVDGCGRPRNRVVHPAWELAGGRAVGWVTTRLSPVKVAHLAANPHVGCAYAGAGARRRLLRLRRHVGRGRRARPRVGAVPLAPRARGVRPGDHLARRPRLPRRRCAAARAVPRAGGPRRRPRPGRGATPLERSRIVVVSAGCCSRPASGRSSSTGPSPSPSGGGSGVRSSPVTATAPVTGSWAAR